MLREEKMKVHQDLLAEGMFLPESPSDLDFKDEENLLLALLVISSLLALGFLCCICCGFKSLKMAIDVIDASADFLARTKRIIFVPCVFFLI
jgi:hypothetical protein